MTVPRALELGLAVLLLAAGVFFYRQRPKDGSSYGNQGAVILLVVGVIIAIHALRLLEYHPTPAEADMIMEHSR